MRRGRDDLQARAESEAYRQRLDVFLASRDVGRTLTLDALRQGVRLETVVAAAADAAAYADEALAIVHDEYRPALDCRAGCSFCCGKPGVLATLPEFLRLLGHVLSAFPEDQLAALRDRAQRYVSQVGGRSVDDPFDEVVPCPLLVDDQCAAYEARPLVCRGYNSTDVAACRAASTDSAETVPIFAVLKDVTDGVTVGVAHALESGQLNAALVDLGTALHAALQSPRDAGLAAVLGEAGPLTPAQNARFVAELWSAVQAMRSRLS